MKTILGRVKRDKRVSKECQKSLCSRPEFCDRWCAKDDVSWILSHNILASEGLPCTTCRHTGAGGGDGASAARAVP